jgi:hypothetical protein
MEDGSWPPVETAGTPQEYADAICAHLNRTRADPSPSADGRAYVESQFNWTLSGQRLHDILQRAARRDSGEQVA